MKNAVIVHCWDGYPNYCWYPQTKKELERKGFNVEIPQMPETNLPKLNKWLPVLEQIIRTPNKDLYLVGHSAGCITILRYLETLHKNQKVGGVILVAGFTNDLGYDELKNFFETQINFEEIKKHCNKFVAINSDNDPYVDLSFGKEFEEKLNAKLIIKHNMGHFSGPVNNEESCTSLPEVSEEIISISQLN